MAAEPTRSQLVYQDCAHAGRNLFAPMLEPWAAVLVKLVGVIYAMPDAASGTLASSREALAGLAQPAANSTVKSVMSPPWH
jgi:hypothetical protein